MTENKQNGPWTVPPELRPRDAEQFKKRGISEAFALASGCRTAYDNEARNIGFSASIPADQLRNGLQGLCFEYRSLTNGHTPTYRLKPEHRFNLNGDIPKYLSVMGDEVRAYYPHTTKAEHMTDVKVNVFITEGEFKALALAERVAPIASRPTVVIGLQGVNGAWGRDKIAVELPDGTHESRPAGHPHLIDDLLAWEWKKRVVYVIFDSDVGSRQNATEFQKSKRSGAWGAEYTLVQLLRALGADARIVIVPPTLTGPKCGIDDYIASLGEHQALRLIYNNWVTERSVEEALYAEKRAAVTFQALDQIVKSSPSRPDSIIDSGILPMGCVAILSGPSGAGKSFIALNACHAVCTGGKFLDMFQCSQGKALYIQTEMPQWSLAERAKGLRGLNGNFLCYTPGYSFPLNFWEQDGFQKKRQTGNQQTVMALMEQIKAHNVSLVVFDPLSDFTTIDLIYQEAANHLMQIFRMIAQHGRCGVLLVHHFRKSQQAGRGQHQETGDEMTGSLVLKKACDSLILLTVRRFADDTRRYKLIFDKVRHGPEPAPLEIQRMTGGNAFGWKAVPWETQAQSFSSADRVLSAMQDGATSPEGIIQKSGLKKTAVYEALKELTGKGIVRKDGDLYYVSGSYDSA